MNTNTKIVPCSLAAIITFLAIQEVIRFILSSSNYTYSIVPGWHTTLFDQGTMATIIAVIISVSTVLAYYFFKLLSMILEKVFLKIKK